MAEFHSNIQDESLIVSVVTVVRDHAGGLMKTYASLNCQDFQRWEMIIVVGDSTDQTLSSSYSLSVSDSRVKVFQQEGLGIYTAMNQGLKLARGKYVWFMNAGDQFFSEGVLLRSVDKMGSAAIGLVVGGYAIRRNKGLEVYKYSGKLLTFLSFAYTRHGGCHQAMLFQTKLLKEIGGYNTRYLLASDFDLIIRVIKNAGAIRVSDIYAMIEPGGQADRSILQVLSEKHQIRREHKLGNSTFLISLVWTFLARTKILMRGLIR